MTMSLPLALRGSFADVRRAIRDRLRLCPEDHHRCLHGREGLVLHFCLAPPGHKGEVSGWRLADTGGVTAAGGGPTGAVCRGALRGNGRLGQVLLAAESGCSHGTGGRPPRGAAEEPCEIDARGGARSAGPGPEKETP